MQVGASIPLIGVLGYDALQNLRLNTLGWRDNFSVYSNWSSLLIRFWTEWSSTVHRLRASCLLSSFLLLMNIRVPSIRVRTSRMRRGLRNLLRLFWDWNVFIRSTHKCEFGLISVLRGRLLRYMNFGLRTNFCKALNIWLWNNYIWLNLILSWADLFLLNLSIWTRNIVILCVDISAKLCWERLLLYIVFMIWRKRSFTCVTHWIALLKLLLDYLLLLLIF